MIGRDKESPTTLWHRVVMRVVGRVEAETPQDALAAAKRAGNVAPIVQPTRN